MSKIYIGIIALFIVGSIGCRQTASNVRIQEYVGTYGEIVPDWYFQQINSIKDKKAATWKTYQKKLEQEIDDIKKVILVINDKGTYTIQKSPSSQATTGTYTAKDNHLTLSFPGLPKSSSQVWGTFVYNKTEKTLIWDNGKGTSMAFRKKVN